MSQSLEIPRTPAQRDRRRAILRAAEKLFADGRFDEVHMEDVARAAGVGKGTLYRYFADKESLYAGVVAAGFDALQARLRSQAGDGDPEARLERTVHAVTEFLGRNRSLIRLLGRDEGEASKRREICQQWRQQRLGLVGAISEVLADGDGSGAFAVPHPRMAAQMLLGMVRSCLRGNDEALSCAQIVDEVVRVFLHGIAAPHNGSRLANVQGETVASRGPCE